ncbi:hypothetical protein B0H15DRAFT_947220 [Mycena belliarum]|uniref:MYND-type domain-containing protein n=1 Tax=Mycena belliarum TaxID=1033014 RepID=A0AAD6U8U5_9AGAR|nr:hypothetical protein B0H15DRAFT_947220 [Mycena belliae]
MSVEEDDVAQLALTGPIPTLRVKLWCTAQLLAPFLSSPERSFMCASAVVKVTQKLLPSDADLKSCIRILRTEQQACLDGLVRFVAVPRTDDQLRDLEARLSECHCNLSYEVLQLVHDNDDHLADFELSFKGMIESIFTVIAAVVFNGLKVGHVVGAQSPTARADSVTKKWPASTAALFPAGPEAAVVSFARLYRLTRSSTILDFIRVTLPHCPSLALPISDSTLFWEAFVDGLQFAVDKFPEDPVLVRRTSHSAETDLDADGPAPRQLIRASTMFLSTFVATYTESLRNQIASSSLMNYARKIHDLLLKVLLLAKRSPNQDMLVTLCLLVSAMALCLGNALPRGQRPARIHPVIKAYGRLQTEPQAWAFADVFAAMGRIAAVAQCCNAICAETSESSAQKLRYCARCRLMRYCSGACQKAAWKYHKTVCTDIDTLHKKVMTKFRDSREVEDFGSPGQCLVDFEEEAKKTRVHGGAHEGDGHRAFALLPLRERRDGRQAVALPSGSP